ncbi:MAG TPA: hypothetical protein VFC65_13835 [Prolixibacteraceae bacterium]|nr:hypothetical protein [Prolixibacteraceae bacterium]
MAKGIKTGGRQKGTSNKLSGTVKEMITQFVTNEIQHLPSLLNRLEPKEKAEYIIKLLPYILPKKATVEEPKEDSPNERRSLMHNMFKTQTSQNTIAK